MIVELWNNLTKLMFISASNELDLCFNEWCFECIIMKRTLILFRFEYEVIHFAYPTFRYRIPS